MLMVLRKINRPNPERKSKAGFPVFRSLAWAGFDSGRTPKNAKPMQVFPSHRWFVEPLSTIKQL